MNIENLMSKINSIKNQEVKNNVEWVLKSLNTKKSKNIIIFARNASGKTTLSNMLSNQSMHYHDEYIKFDSESSTPHMILGDKVKKFTYSERKIYSNILRNEKDGRSLGELARKIKSSLFYYKGSASIVGFHFLNSLNEKLINQAWTSYDPKLANKSLSNQEYCEEDYYLRPYVYFNRGISAIEKIKSSVPKDAPSFIGDGKFIESLLNSAISNETKNGIYGLIIYLSSFYDAVNSLIFNGMGLINSLTNERCDSPNINLRNLLKINKELINYSIIDEQTTLIQDDKKRLLFMKENKNITMEVFSLLSKGQNDLLSMIFFTEITKEEESIIVDDPFDSLDYINTYKMIKVIRSRESNKKMIILFHSSSHLSMLKQYLTKVQKWEIFYMNIQQAHPLKESKDLLLRIKQAYKTGEDYGEGIFLLIRHIKNLNYMNTFIYNVPPKNIKDELVDKNIPGKIPTSKNLEIYQELLLLFDKIVVIKRWFKNLKNSNKIKNKMKNGAFYSEDKKLQLYSNIIFIINDLSHNNKWGLDVLDVLSYKKEIEQLRELLFFDCGL